MASNIYYETVPAPAVDGNTIIIDPSTGKLKSGISGATTSADGLMSADDKNKLDGIEVSSVSWEQNLSDGVQIATVIINGESTNVYVPDSIGTQIDDSNISTETVWSSDKVNTEIANKSEFPSSPTESGNYVLKLKVENGEQVYSWEKITNLEEVRF